MIGTRVRSAALTALACLLLTVAALNAAQFSSAAYTASSANPGSTASAAIDWTPPRVAMQDPGTALKGTVALTATATDAETGVRNVSFAVLSRGDSTWTQLCTTSTSPYRCSWDTRSVADGRYEIRAIAVDNAGYSSTSMASTTVINSFGVQLADPGDIVQGTVPLSATLLNASFGIHSVRIEYAPAGTENWTSVCFSLFAPYTCSWNTSRLADGVYDLRAVATQGFSTTAYFVVEGVRVDNGGTSRVVSLNQSAAPAQAASSAQETQGTATQAPTSQTSEGQAPQTSSPGAATSQPVSPGAAVDAPESAMTETDAFDE